MDFHTQEIWYGSFWLCAAGRTPSLGDECIGGLISPADEGLIIQTGAHGGVVAAAALVLDGEHQAPGTDEWEDVAEAWFDFTEPEIYTFPTYSDDNGLTLHLQHPGGHTVRVYARGRDTSYDVSTLEPTEWFLLALWPSEHNPGRALKMTSRVARHKESTADPNRPPQPQPTATVHTETLPAEPITITHDL